ncbi:hypothetical protein L2E82_16519 [Cichorium intybus]|uniref:Uncharacterized protein n=1 Tax=Cichorium intybus TaxID=13427 RepID=A0ACB9F688_CICIN|nr:hypothetical protein L2E82_16519 [Cichorium intybus]
MATQSATSASSSSNIPPPPPPKESLGRRYKFIWPLLLAVNFSIGAYLFTRTNKEEKTEEEVPSTVVTSTSTPTSVSPATIPKKLDPIPMDQQKELFKWILEEKRKVKTKNPQEKKQIDEEKAILKQFIRAKNIPSF